MACPERCTVGDVDYTLGAVTRECMENGEWAQMIIDCAEDFGVECENGDTPARGSQYGMLEACREAQCTVGDMDYTLGACQPRECMETEWAR